MDYKYINDLIEQGDWTWVERSALHFTHILILQVDYPLQPRPALYQQLLLTCAQWGWLNQNEMAWAQTHDAFDLIYKRFIDSIHSRATK